MKHSVIQWYTRSSFTLYSSLILGSGGDPSWKVGFNPPKWIDGSFGEKWGKFCSETKKLSGEIVRGKPNPVLEADEKNTMRRQRCRYSPEDIRQSRSSCSVVLALALHKWTGHSEESCTIRSRVFLWRIFRRISSWRGYLGVGGGFPNT